jgi:hypothetical protein
MRGRVIPVAVFLGLYLLLAGSCAAQDQNAAQKPAHDYSDPPANAVIHNDRPFTVRNGKGVVELHDGGSGLPGIRVELVNANGHVKKAKTNDDGRFKIHGLADGTYKFKIKGFATKSATGTVIVQHNAPNPDQLIIETELGLNRIPPR